MIDEDKALKEGEETTPSESPTEEDKGAREAEQTGQQPEDKGEEDSKPEGSTEGQDEDKTDDSQNVDKTRQTRGQKRIRDLVTKVKEASGKTGEEEDSPQEEDKSSKGLPWKSDSNPFEGMDEVDPEQLDKVVTEKAAAIAELQVKKILSQKDAADSYHRAVNDWTTDMEKLTESTPALNPTSPEYNEELDSALHEMVIKTNFTAKGELVPTLKASEIFGMLRKSLEVERSRGQSEAGQALSEHADDAAIKPNAGAKRGGYTPEELQKLKFTNPGKVAEILEETLPHAED